MSETIREKTQQHNKFDAITKLVMLLLPILMLVVFLNSNNSLFCGPILAIIFTYLFLFGKHELVIAVIIVANDALGTILLGSISFQYLLLVLAVLKTSSVKMPRRNLVCLSVCLLFLLQLVVVETINFRMLIITFSYVFGISCIDFNDKSSAKSFFKGIAFTVIIIAIHTTITGGVDFAEEQMGTFEERRRGILGVGIGDSNFSSYLLCVGLVCLWYFCEMLKIYKIIFTIPMVYSLIITRSTMGVLVFFFIIMLAIMLGENKLKRMVILLFTIIGLIVLYNVYVDLPEKLHLLELDLYIERIQDKITQIFKGDYNSATTGRSDLLSRYLRYIFIEQSELKLLFGGNQQQISTVAKEVPHNTYITVLLQFGLVGAIIFFSFCIYRVIVLIKRKSNVYYKPFLILKSISLIVALSLSLFDGNLWVLWMFILLVL